MLVTYALLEQDWSSVESRSGARNLDAELILADADLLKSSSVATAVVNDLLSVVGVEW